MTTQMKDAVRYRGEEWALFASTSTLLDVGALDLKFTFVSTDCWRGYHCVYEITESELLLQEFHAGLDPAPPSLFGVGPTFETVEDFPVSYLSIGRALPFSGWIVLAADPLNCSAFQDELYEFKWVLEVQVEGGVVVDTTDHAHTISRLRSHMRKAKATFVAPPDGVGRSWEDQRTLDLADACRETFYWKYFQARLERFLELRTWADEHGAR